MPYGMIPKLIEEVHFNDQKPENKNIVLRLNKNDNKIKIFTGLLMGFIKIKMKQLRI